VTDLKEFLCPLIFTSYPNGWYENNSKIIFSLDDAEGEHSDAEHSLPPFCRDMATCDWLSFELNCFFLLRLLGIHDIRKVPQENNRGMPDGYFQIDDLAVIYDATIMDHFLITKEKQIQLYIRQLKENRFLFNDTCSKKHVWIITRNPACRLIDTIDGIQVKEIPYHELIKVFIHRLDNEVDSNRLATILKNVGTDNYTYYKDGVKYTGYERQWIFNDLGLDSDFDLVEVLD
jgi:hypothetical protein